MNSTGTGQETPLRHTPLDAFHRSHGAHMVPFAGWEMPLYYASIMEEHAAVRTGVGLFDVSHMGILTVSGEHSIDLLSRRTTTNAAKMLSGQVRYGFWLNSEGHILDDLLLTRLDEPGQGPPRFLVVPNASRADRIFDLLQEHRLPDTAVRRHNGNVAILAVQGPKSRELLEGMFGWTLAGMKFYNARAFPATSGPSSGRLGGQFPELLGSEIQVSRTGYTGELGYELFVSAERAPKVAAEIVHRGAKPIGLGARDTLRLEKGYLLSGSDFNIDRSPIEAGQERFVEMDHPFVGREVLEAQQKDGVRERFAGLEVREPGVIPRHGMPILKGETPVGRTTSGGLSPTLNFGIALGYLPPDLNEPGTELAMVVRGRRVPAKVVRLPFVPQRPARP
jgi:aminomethyltransferase